MKCKNCKASHLPGEVCPCGEKKKIYIKRLDGVYEFSEKPVKDWQEIKVSHEDLSLMRELKSATQSLQILIHNKLTK